MATATTSEKRTAVRGLGEIAFRVNNLDAMQKFYEEVIGLPLMARDHNCAFFKIAEGFGGHTQCLPCSTAHRIPAIAGRTWQLRPLTTSHSRYLLPFRWRKEKTGVFGTPSRDHRTRMGALALSLCGRSGGESSGASLLAHASV